MNKNNFNTNKPVVSASLDSSHLKEAKYDPFMKVLTLSFHSGQSYDFLEVDRTIFDELTEAESPGKFFHQKIRGKFEAMKRTWSSDD